MLRLMRFIMVYVAALPMMALAAAAEFRAGAATSNITPALGGDIIGNFVPTEATHVHDELHARCLVLDDGQQRLALVVCDLLGLDPLVCEEAKQAITAKTKIPRECILISVRIRTRPLAHWAGIGLRWSANSMTIRSSSRAASLMALCGRTMNCGRPRSRSEPSISRTCVQSPLEDAPRTVPANPFGGVDQVKMNPPAGSPNLTEPAGPTDPTVSFFMIREPDGKPISVYAAYSLHYVGGVGAGHISSDYYGMFCEHLTKLLDADHQSPPFVAMLANGTSGDINNINFRQPRGRKQPYEQMHYVAEDVANKVHQQSQKLTYRRDITLDARATVNRRSPGVDPRNSSMNGLMPRSLRAKNRRVTCLISTPSGS